MLIELHIENLAIIDRLDLNLVPGLVAFTGETGAGKSIIIDAIDAILGGRADATLIRGGADRASVEGVFAIPEAARASLQAILEREELYDNPDYLILAREIRQNGRNVARINGRTVSTGLLREVGEYLVDVHGQSEHLSLLRINQHLGMLDNFAATSRVEKDDHLPPIQELLAAYRQSYRSLQAVRHELAELQQAERDRARRVDMLSYQINEIESARLRPGEDEELREERNRLANAEGLATLVQEALAALEEGSPETPAASDLVGQVTHALAGLSRLDPSQAGLLEQGQTLLEGLSELSVALRDYQEGIEFNPKRLNQVEDRLGMIQSLKRKYGDTIPAILEFAQNAQREFDSLTHAEERIEELQVEEEQLLEQVTRDGQALSQKRHAAAERLAQAIEAELVDLHMAGARFTTDFKLRPDPQGVNWDGEGKVAFDASGLERVEFLIAPNEGEGFKPLAKIASGGETSRLMLALKNVLAKADQIPTLIFDEIDQGIGGRVGTVVGQKLWMLGRQHQVLCITHLPQLAVFGDQHFNVQKHVEEGRTTTEVRPLEGDERVHELAQMLGDVSEATLSSARELLETVRERTSSQ